ncbi:DUF2189 domain-containing protein [Mangrovitalea sediminis]|uniref:hypothetical protein n=1 Tax=Mangrovitalea sediminis TaxID=1982043 RepID=UPI000BE5E2FF|nr:hypothetical protein [Mangrovitalea sediminis]
MKDVYAAPQADLEVPVTLKDYGSVEQGISGQYELRIGDIIREAWEKTKGVKGSFVLAFVFYFLISVVLNGAFRLLGYVWLGTQNPGLHGDFHAGFFVIQQLVSILVTMPLAVGLFMMGVRRAVDAPVRATMIFAYYGKSLTFLAAIVLICVLIMIGLVLLIVPGIYLAFAYYLSLPLMVDKGLSIWAAMETSRKAISKRWFTFAGLYILLGLIGILAAIPLLIPLIWVGPMIIIAGGIMYRNIFGCEAETVA